jgi:hypothetical protein
MTGWNVYIDNPYGPEALIDTVFYDDDCDEDYVRRGLIEHDGYDPAIRVSKD